MSIINSYGHVGLTTLFLGRLRPPIKVVNQYLVPILLPFLIQRKGKNEHRKKFDELFYGKYVPKWDFKSGTSGFLV